ncbi:hypothetical protein BGO17_02645 [Candidatus Saccharibacteria bacterium 49-20]|nr:MAG: hypothetical protein BGO17_02645 [Candidatus Saccharibacteria bacterium 49-20]
MRLLDHIMYPLSFPARMARLEQKFVAQEAGTHSWEEVVAIMTTPNSPHDAPRRIRLSKPKLAVIWTTVGFFFLYAFNVIDV